MFENNVIYIKITVKLIIELTNNTETYFIIVFIKHLRIFNFIKKKKYAYIYSFIKLLMFFCESKKKIN